MTTSFRRLSLVSENVRRSLELSICPRSLITSSWLFLKVSSAQPIVTFHLVHAFLLKNCKPATGLLDDRDPSQSSLNNPVVDFEGQSLTVSSLSVRFGLNFKAQLAVVVLFTIANGNGNSIREGWSQVSELMLLRCMIRLFTICLFSF